MDLISRQAAIELIGSMFTDTGDENILELWRQFRNMPSAERRGRWMIQYGEHEAFGIRPFYRFCSECNEVTVFPYRYCPNCGAKMDESEK